MTWTLEETEFWKSLCCLAMADAAPPLMVGSPLIWTNHFPVKPLVFAAFSCSSETLGRDGLASPGAADTEGTGETTPITMAAIAQRIPGERLRGMRLCAMCTSLRRER